MLASVCPWKAFPAQPNVWVRLGLPQSGATYRYFTRVGSGLTHKHCALEEKLASVCPWKAFPAQSHLCGSAMEYPRVEHIKGTTLGQGLALLTNIVIRSKSLPVFVLGKPYKPILMFVGQARITLEWSTSQSGALRVGSVLTHKHQTWLERPAKKKHQPISNIRKFRP